MHIHTNHDARRSSLRRLAVVATATAVGLTLSACGQQPGSASSTPPAAAQPAAPEGPTATPETAGAVTSTVEATVPPSAPTVSVTGAATPATVGDLSVKLTSAQKLTAKSAIPSEGAGPAVAVTFEVTNNTAQDYESDQWEASLTDADGDAATRYTSAPAKALPPVLRPGQSATTTMVFLVHSGARSKVTVLVSTVPGERAIAYTGTPA